MRYVTLKNRLSTNGKTAGYHWKSNQCSWIPHSKNLKNSLGKTEKFA
jgi:hypothetical protein